MFLPITTAHDTFPAISVVICTRNRSRELERCLEGLSHQRHRPFSVVVVDSAPDGAAAREIAQRWNAEYAIEPRQGLSRARNLGMRASTGEIIALLDDDAAPDPDWLRNLAVEFADPAVIAVAGRIQELRNAANPSDCVREFFSLDNVGVDRRVVDRTDPQWFEIANFGGIGRGSNMAFRRSALKSWPGFDHRLGRGTRISGSEEHYAFFRLIELGHRVVYGPDALVLHPYPADLSALRSHELRQLAASTAYLSFLFFEAPGHRIRIIRYVVEAMCGVRRHWRAGSPKRAPGLVPRWRRLAALVYGPMLYLQTVLDQMPQWGRSVESELQRFPKAALSLPDTGKLPQISGRVLPW